MAKLPDHIDKNDKKAVAAYFIRERWLKEQQAWYDSAMESQGNDYIDVIGDFNRYSTDVGDYLVLQGYTVENVGHITWRITKPKKTS